MHAISIEEPKDIRGRIPVRMRLKFKRGFDMVIAISLVVVMAPILLGIASLILILDGRPVLFKQTRVGKDERPFTIYKFRTMVRDADMYLKADLTTSSRRVTKIGGILRRFSLDELPQLFNIIKGEMSVVGPRATLPEVHERFSEVQRLRTRMRPGVTGLAQVGGRNDIPWSERILLDNTYIDQYSLKLDLEILLKTVVVWLTGKGFALDRTKQQIDTSNLDSSKEPSDSNK